MMRRIIITPEEPVPNEAARLTLMLRTGAERVHLRHPGASVQTTAAILDGIPADLRCRVSLHDHFELAATYGTGVNLNSRNPVMPTGFTGTLSASCHNADDLLRNQYCDYLLFSPVFASISKPGYRPDTHANLMIESRYRLFNEKTFAMGGVTPQHFEQVKAMGFGGVAMLGAAWHELPWFHRRAAMQFITPPGLSRSELSAIVGKVLRGGCRWVQLRMKDASPDDIVVAGRNLADYCSLYGATFIIDDHVELVEACGADGVHLGANDMPVAEARRILGPGYIVGATANTLDMLRRAWADGADYAGLGPLRFTTTKKNLSPVLGFDGYSTILAAARAEGIDFPVVAIGGITDDDIAPLARAGVRGVAVSGTIATDPDPSLATERLLQYIQTYMQ